MMYVAMNECRISNPVILGIDIETALWEDTLYSNMNATKNGANVGGALSDLDAVKFNVFRNRYFDLDEDDKIYYKAEVLVKHHIPLSAITNIENPPFAFSSNTTPFTEKQILMF